MTLREFAEKIINNPKTWDYQIINGKLTLDDDLNDESQLNIDKEEITITDFFINNFEKL